MLEAVKGEKLELVVTLALFYGLRRSEVLGLRWGTVDFERETIVINHSLNQAFIDGKYTMLPQDKLKRTASFRTFRLFQLLLQFEKALDRLNVSISINTGSVHVYEH